MKYNRRRTLNVCEEGTETQEGRKGCKVYVENIREKSLVIYLRARTIYIIPYQ